MRHALPSHLSFRIGHTNRHRRARGAIGGRLHETSRRLRVLRRVCIRLQSAGLAGIPGDAGPERQRHLRSTRSATAPGWPRRRRVGIPPDLSRYAVSGGHTTIADSTARVARSRFWQCGGLVLSSFCSDRRRAADSSVAPRGRALDGRAYTWVLVGLGERIGRGAPAEV